MTVLGALILVRATLNIAQDINDIAAQARREGRDTFTPDEINRIRASRLVLNQNWADRLERIRQRADETEPHVPAREDSE